MAPIAENATTTTDLKCPEVFDQWALVELFGHQKIVGRVREATLAAGAFIRVDVPEVNGTKPYTRFFSPGAIYSVNPVTEEVARQLLQVHSNPPVHRYELPEPESDEDVPGTALPGMAIEDS